MDNLGHKLLQQFGLLDSPDSVKICALAALDLSMSSSAGKDMYPIIWKGNIAGEEPIVRTIRRSIYRGATSAVSLSSAIGIPYGEVLKFVDKQEKLK